MGISPGEGPGEGTPSPPTRTIPAFLQGSRAGAGVLAARARTERKHGEGRPLRGEPDSALLPHHPIHRTVGISPGEGAGEGTPSPPTRTILALLQGSRAGAGFSWREPERGATGGDEPGHYSPTLPPRPRFALLPASRTRGGNHDIPKKSQPLRGEPDSALLPHHPIHRTVRGEGQGGGRRGNPECTFSRHLAIHTSLLTPTPPAPSALLPRPRGGGSSRDTPRKGTSTGKASPGRRTRFRPPPAPSHTPYRGGYRLGRGPGREPPPRQREPYRPSHRAPAQERGSRGESPDGVQPEKRNRGEATLISRFAGISPYIALLTPTPPAPVVRSSPAPGRWSATTMSQKRPARGGAPSGPASRQLLQIEATTVHYKHRLQPLLHRCSNIGNIGLSRSLLSAERGHVRVCFWPAVSS